MAGGLAVVVPSYKVFFALFVVLAIALLAGTLPFAFLNYVAALSNLALIPAGVLVGAMALPLASALFLRDADALKIKMQVRAAPSGNSSLSGLPTTADLGGRAPIRRSASWPLPPSSSP
jgi:hypothetical protein